MKKNLPSILALAAVVIGVALFIFGTM